MIPDTIGGLATPLMTGAALFWINWKLASATVLTGFLATGIFGYMMGSFSMDEFYALMDRMNAIVIQYINGMKVIKAYTRTDFSFQQYRDVVEQVRNVYQSISAKLAAPYAVMLVLMRSTAVTVVPAGLLLYLRNEIDVSKFVLFVVMGIGFNQPLLGCLMHGGQSYHMVYSASKRLIALFETKELEDPLLPQAPTHNTVSFENVSFGYNDETLVLRNISFDVPEGSVVALVGPSGSGKSTIAKLAARFWDVNGGAIKLGGVNIKCMAMETLMNQVCFVFQDIFLFNDSVANNIGLGRRNATQSEIEEAAKIAQCHKFILSLPQGYDTIVGDNGVKLSGGQRQRLSIARAILKDSPIIILDEATAFVDPENEALVQEAVAGLLSKKAKTLIVIAHRLSTIQGADQILVVDKGAIVARGTHEKLLGSCLLYRDQWEAHNSASEWQYGGGSSLQADASPPLVGDLTEVEKPLVNIYSGLDPTSNAYTLLRKFVPPEESFLLRRVALFRASEGALQAVSCYAVYLALLAVLVSQSKHYTDHALLWRSVGILVFSCCAQVVMSYNANLQGHKLLIAIQSKLRVFLADFTRRLPMGFLTTRDTGSIDSLFTTAILFLEPHHLLDSLVLASVTPFIIFLIVMVYEWRMSLMLLSSVFLSIVALKYGEYVYDRVEKVHHEARQRANSRMVEYVQGIAVIRSFNLAGVKLELFGNSIRDYRDAALAMLPELIPAVIAFKVLLELGYAALVAFGASLLDNAKITPESYLVCLVLGLSFYGPLFDLAAQGEIFKMMQRSARLIVTHLNEPLLPVSASHEIPGSAAIEFRDVTFAYENDKAVLENVSFSVPAGSTVALVGPSGSGKTTVTSLLARFWDTIEGDVLVGGANVKKIATNVLLNQLSMVFQDTYLFQDTVYNNIKFGNPSATEEEVMTASMAAQCHSFVISLPQGYRTMVGEGGATLSGGEKQRISIARALLKAAPIVVLDEATASVDPENERHIQLAIQALSNQKTLLVIAHRLTTIASADSILVFQDGRIIEKGKHEYLLNRGGLYAKLWTSRIQSQGWTIAK